MTPEKFNDIISKTPKDKKANFKLLYVPTLPKLYGEDLKIGDTFEYIENEKRIFGALVSHRTGKHHSFSPQHLKFVGYY